MRCTCRIVRDTDVSRPCCALPLKQCQRPESVCNWKARVCGEVVLEGAGAVVSAVNGDDADCGVWSTCSDVEEVAD